MSAYIWNANPEKWHAATPNQDSWASLEAYLNDPSNYVYWSTPQLRDKIRIGDAAYIWRTQYKQHRSGIVAVGEVAERPMEIHKGSFLRPARLPAAGWNESEAPSKWKTGIRITHIFWKNALRPTEFKPAQGTVRTLSPAEVAALDKLVRGRTGHGATGSETKP